MPRAKALVVRVEDRAGMLGRVASALSARKVNLRAVQAGNEGGQGVIRMVVDDLALAKEVLASNGWPPEEEEILEIELSDEPGTLGEAATLLGNAGVNIRYVFVTTAGSPKATAFLSVSDMEAALRVLG